MLLEELDKGRRTGKVEPVCNLLHGEVGGAQQHLRLYEYGLVYPVEDRTPGDALDGGREVLGRDAQAVGVVAYGVLFAEVYGQQAEEAVAEALVADVDFWIQI